MAPTVWRFDRFVLADDRFLELRGLDLSVIATAKFDFDRPTAALVGSLNPRYRRLIRLESLAALLLHASLVWVFGIPLAIYYAVYCGFGISWSAMQYVHHFGTERHVTGGAEFVAFRAD